MIWGGVGNDLTPAAFLAGHRMAPGRVPDNQYILAVLQKAKYSGHLEARFLRNCLAFAHRTC